MDDGATIRLTGERTRDLACELVRKAPNGWTATIDAPPRTLDQNSRFWATCAEVAKLKTVWGNHVPDKQGWHDLFLSGWNVVKGRPVRLLSGLEGERVSLIPHSRWMSESEMSDLLDYTSAWCAVKGIALKE